ncbi:MAG: ribosome maturation factor RimM [Anaerolineae bacterium]|nr:ribosome maturation factor RimM [Thermoflexales bacterium]MDW8395460.1 ribosome maturation factor RimM [Anaerolineae bacterium]
MPRGTAELLQVGEVVRPHGVAGEVKVAVAPEYLDAFLEGISRVYLGPQQKPHAVLNARPHQGALLLLLEGIQSRNQAELLRGAPVFIRIADLPPLPEGAYYVHELLGLQVYDQDTGALLGELAEVLATGSNDVYVVRRPGGRELLLPALESVVLLVDLDAGVMRVRVPPGL